MTKISGLENWDLSAVPLTEQVASVSVFVAYPKVSEELLALTPKGRKGLITYTMRTEIDAVLAINKLSDWQLLKTGGQRGRYHGIRGQIKVADMQEVAALATVQSIQVEETNGRKKRIAKPRKKLNFYCVKMTVAIQIEGYDKGKQRYEERYVLFKGHSETEALRKAEVAALEYQHSYLNSDGLLVRWKMESLDNAYEVVLAAGADNLEGAEVFSALKTRRRHKPDSLA
ncbi:hypothetical protein A0257_09555 [Hymenobacter psoromatis]|nr:hypothetical protein A0257_09555 [Hymenobacter psoromatis]